MSKSPDEIAAGVIATLATTAPGLSCERGTPERKIIDACSEAISEAYVDQYLVGSLLDIENKVGLELEQFVGIFGFGRLQGKAATGVVRMTVVTPLQTDQELSLGSQFFTKSTPAGTGPLYFASTQAVVLVAGSFSVDVPVQCTVVGTQGNVGPDTVSSLGSTLATSSVTNLVAFTGGVDVETDPELRARFKNTLLRNIAGTSDWYKALCLQNNKVSRVEVYGPTTLYKMQISVPSTTLGLSLTSNVKYVWPEMESVFINLGQEDEKFYEPGNDYSLTSGVSPVFTRIGSGELVEDDIVDLEFQYTTASSRNDPINDVTNKVDVFVDGVDPFTVTEKTLVTSTTLSSDSENVLFTGNFERVGTAGSPSATNRFMRLASVPVVSFPSTVVVGVTVYTLGTHYHLLRSTTLLAGSHVEVSGIEWAAAGPANDTELTITYIYNRVPELLSALIGTAKQVTTDVMVHQANWRYVVPCLSIEFDRSYSVQLVTSAISDHLQRFFSSLQYGASVKISTLALVVQQVLGVVNVKLTTIAENPTHYGVEIYNDPTDVSPASVETTDFRFDDNALPVLSSVRVTRNATT